MGCRGQDPPPRRTLKRQPTNFRLVEVKVSLHVYMGASWKPTQAKEPNWTSGPRILTWLRLVAESDIFDIEAFAFTKYNLK